MGVRLASSRSLGIRSRGRGILVGLSVGAVLVGVAACGSGSSPKGSGSSATQNVNRAAELRVGLTNGGHNFDPHKSPAATGDASWMMPVYDRLTMLTHTSDGKVVVGPQLATAWAMSADGLSVTFTLRSDVKFSDGTTFDAAAVKANIDRAKGPGSTIASVLSYVQSVEVKDATHAIFHLTAPNPGMLYDLAVSTTGMMASPAAFNSDLANKPVGSGPYKLVSFTDTQATFERWDGHWNTTDGLAAKLTFSYIADSNARLNAIRSGQLDLGLVQGADLPAKQVADSNPGQFQFHTEGSPLSIGFFFNTKMAPFDNVNVRKAISMAMKRTDLLPLTDNFAQPVYQVFSKGYLGYDPALDKDPYNVDAAKKLIQDAGLSGQTLTMLVQNNAPYNNMAQVVQQALGAIGLTVKLNVVSPTEVFPTWTKGGSGFALIAITSEGDPTITLSKQYTGGYNLGTPPAELVQLANDAAKIPAGDAKRDAAYQKVNQYLAANPIQVPLVSFYSNILGSKKVIGLNELIKISTGKMDIRGIGIAAS